MHVTIVRGSTMHARLIAPPAAYLTAAEALTVFDEGAEFSPAYQVGRWDGFVRLFNRRTGEFPGGLARRIITALAESDITCVLHDEIPSRCDPYAAKPTTVEWRDYQIKAVNDAIAEKRCVVEAPTGSGKTLIGAEIVRRLGRPTLWLTHTTELLKQTHGVLRGVLAVPVGRVGGGLPAIDGPVTVAMVQTLSRKLDTHECREWLKQWEVVIVDEAHHNPAKTWMEVSEHTTGFWRIGLTGTGEDTLPPVRALKLEGGLGPTIKTKDMSALVDEGHLPSFTVTWLVPPIDSYVGYPAIRDLVCPDWRSNPRMLSRRGAQLHRTTYDLGVIDNPHRHRAILSVARAHAKRDERVLILCERILHANRLLDALGRSGWDRPAWMLDGDANATVRDVTLNTFRETPGSILIATPFFREGVDVPEIDVLIMAGAGESPIQVLQSIGRAIRGTSPKRVYDVFDGPGIHEKDYLRNHAVSRRLLYAHKGIEQFEIRAGSVYRVS